MRSKGQGINAATWFYSQPGFHQRPVEWDQERACTSCGKPVELSRRCYSTPMCFACLPPPPRMEER